MARLTDGQVHALAALEREHGGSRRVPPGPRRERMLRDAVTYGAIVVVLDTSGVTCTCCCPHALVEDDGRITILDPT